MKKVWKIIKRTFIILFIAQLAYIVILKWVNPPITVTQIGSLIEGRGLARDYISYDEMPKSAKLAAIASEDQLFATHNGFDKKSIEKALEFNEKKEGKKVRGASTISQQVAKNVFLWQGRSWFRKGLEAYFTFMIELVWSKERILEMYLNVSETGIGTFGIEAASQRYFKKPASNLTKNEAARIVVNLPNPKKYKVNPPSGYVSKRAKWVERQMRNLDGDKDIEELVK
ncbi:monofunctional biosynthetic peptidoglycan transglycosylase [Moheibacter sediminis]|uniref:Biosynthetic peptidoglycan transglycosylase n=1 Tax=Moheibacter sediminis TaxID=1434700 RepID=A0A1W1ZE17_9FLAO|nr:monofunctional biosynthetic peptidoglycan transglycosylase [Moheibacter sediminis]SMC46699.1 monofunctional biosynthetic peptidoglycan transglycosylase [Moheibacter sediminis]